jgi:hypothetical protein
VQHGLAGDGGGFCWHFFWVFSSERASMNQTNGGKVATPSKTLEHLKARGLAWVIVLSVVTLLAYLVFAIHGHQTESELTANVPVALATIIAGYAGAIALLMLALMPEDQLGELSDYKFHLVIGIMYGVAMALIKSLALFKLLR